MQALAVSSWPPQHRRSILLLQTECAGRWTECSSSPKPQGGAFTSSPGIAQISAGQHSQCYKASIEGLAFLDQVILVEQLLERELVFV